MRRLCNGDLPEGMSHHERLMSPHDSLKIALLSDMFEIIDKDGSGDLDIKEVKAYLSKYHGGEPTEESFAAFMEAADTNKDGRISFVELVGFVLKME